VEVQVLSTAPKIKRNRAGVQIPALRFSSPLLRSPYPGIQNGPRFQSGEGAAKTRASSNLAPSVILKKRYLNLVRERLAMAFLAIGFHLGDLQFPRLRFEQF
jgi:hypothetical protein